MPELQKISVDGWPLAAVAIFIALDFASGLAKAWVSKTLSSTTMREGRGHKFTYIILIALAVAVEVFQLHFEVFSGFPTAIAVCCYVCLTEVISIVENIAEINPDLQSWPLVQNILNKSKE